MPSFLKEKLLKVLNNKEVSLSPNFLWKEIISPSNFKGNNPGFPRTLA